MHASAGRTSRSNVMYREEETIAALSGKRQRCNRAFSKPAASLLPVIGAYIQIVAFCPITQRSSWLTPQERCGESL